MKKTFIILFSLAFTLTAMAQEAAQQPGTMRKPRLVGKLTKVQITGKVPGLCDRKAVYSLNNAFEGQEEAIPPLSKEQFIHKLNNDVTFLNENPKYKGEGMIGLYISCNGEVALCQMDIPTKSQDLNEELVEVIKAMGNWKAGKVNQQEVDSSIEFKILIKKGLLSFVED